MRRWLSCVLQQFVQGVRAGPDRRAPAAAARSLDVVDLVVNEENFVWGKAAPLFYPGEKFRSRLRPAEVCSVVNGIETALEGQASAKGNPRAHAPEP
jgi:hypothetical protein